MRCALTAAYDETVLESLSVTFLSGSEFGMARFEPSRISHHSNRPSDVERNVEPKAPTTVPSSAAVSAKR